MNVPKEQADVTQQIRIDAKEVSALADSLFASLLLVGEEEQVA